MKTATVIGLGMMGTTLARLLLRAGYRVTVWNRSASKASSLVDEGAVRAATPTEAVAASEFVVVCVYDYPASDAILKNPGVEAVLAGRTVIQLTTGSPRDARESEAWAQGHGARYLDGGIQAAPEQMGDAATTILLSGAEDAFRDSEGLLKVFAGNLAYLGADIARAAAMDLATLSYGYGSFLGFFHGALIAEAEGIPLDQYGAVIAEVAPAFGDFLKHEGAVLQSGDFAVSQSPLKISIEATERMLATARESGISTRFPEFVVPFFRQAKVAGLEDQELAALIKVFRAPLG
jgi:3-hydroxyisobutyrate dehydrogenase-like beta-hydroxyacid dehydrogenase